MCQLILLISRFLLLLHQMDQNVSLYGEIDFTLKKLKIQHGAKSGGSIKNVPVLCWVCRLHRKCCVSRRIVLMKNETILDVYKRQPFIYCVLLE